MFLIRFLKFLFVEKSESLVVTPLLTQLSYLSLALSHPPMPSLSIASGILPAGWCVAANVRVGIRVVGTRLAHWTQMACASIPIVSSLYSILPAGWCEPPNVRVGIPVVGTRLAHWTQMACASMPNTSCAIWYHDILAHLKDVVWSMKMSTK